MMHDVPRQILATIAAFGVLSGSKTFGRDGEMSLKDIRDRLGSDKHITDEALLGNLESLVSAKMLSKWNTGHKGYGDTWIDGHDTWKVTEAGLIRLWGGF